MADREKVLKFLELVIDRTREGKLDWSENPQAAVFSAVLPDGNILKSFDYSVEQNDGLPSLSIFTSANKMALDIQGTRGENLLNRQLRQVYDLAKAQATGEEKTLDEVLDFLKQL